MHEQETYGGVLSNDTEEWWKIWRGIDKFWLENSKVSKIYTLMGWFWPYYIIFELKKYREVMLNHTQD